MKNIVNKAIVIGTAIIAILMVVCACVALVHRNGFGCIVSGFVGWAFANISLAISKTKQS